jgi:hypothetical protein
MTQRRTDESMQWEQESESTSRPPNLPTPRLPGPRMKRRGILAAAGAVVAGIVAKQVSQPVGAYTGGTAGTALILGANHEDGTANTADRTTVLFNTNGGTPSIGSYYVGDAFLAASVDGIGAKGVSRDSCGLYGFSTNSIGIVGSSNGSHGVQGAGSGSHSGVLGYGGSSGGVGVVGITGSISPRPRG